MSSRASHTYAILEVSKATYVEIKEAFERAGYEHAIQRGDVIGTEILVMNGVALREKSGG